MTRSSGPSRQAPQWQQRAMHDPEAANRQQEGWQPYDQGGYATPQGAPDNPFGAAEQGYEAQQPHGQPDQFGAHQSFGHPQQPANPYYPEADQHQPTLPGGQSGYSEFGHAPNQAAQPLQHAPPEFSQQPYSQFDTSATQPPASDGRGGYSQYGQNEAPSYGQFRPSAFDQEPNTNWQHPQANQAGAADAGLYDFGNYMPAGGATGRPQFGDPGYVPPQQEWDVNPPLNGLAPGDQFGHQRPDGYDGSPHGLQSNAIAQHDDGYGDEGDEDYDDYYDEEEGGTGRKLIIAGALVSAIVVGGGFAYGYNTLFGEQNKSGDTPVVAAASGAAKEPPSSAGGRTFDNKDSKLLGKLGNAGGSDPDKVGNRVRSVPTLVVGPDGRLVVPEAPENNQAGSGTPAVEPAQSTKQSASVSSTTSVPGMIVSGGSGLSVQPPAVEAQTASVSNTRVPPATQQLQPQVQAQQPVQVASAPPAAAPPVKRRRNSKFPPLPVRSGLTKPQFTTASTVTPAAVRPAASGVASANVTRVIPNQQQRPAPRRPQPAAVAAPAAAAAGAGGIGYVAVLSTKRSRIDALTSFADLQQKYTSILSTKVPDVRRTDLTSRGLGVMYRAVVGPPGSKQAAGQLCNRLKTAGYTGCWVAAY
ncbi:MAG: SPOR domain-containing protein [Pseudomonadota bacterium]